ncbi:MAG: class A beta-lactamase-related serine hydrolase, partial [Actinomycetota bacterium]|nr:class A beta-lactamase-related serine hydrolase [Actinomycetota bacterium]
MPGADAARTELDRIADRDGTVLSVWAGPTDGSTSLTRLPDTDHQAASTLKLPLAVAVLGAVETGRLDIDAPVLVRAEFSSVVGD